MPFIFEEQSDSFIENVFWRNQMPLTNAQLKISESPSYSSSIPITSSYSSRADVPLAYRMLNSILALLFFPDFTVTPSNQNARAFLIPLNHVWYFFTSHQS